MGAVHFFFCKSGSTCLIGLFVTFLLLPLPHAPIVYIVGRPDTRPNHPIPLPNLTKRNPWTHGCALKEFCWQVGVSVCGFVLCSSPAWAGKVSWWLSGGSELRLCLRWASLKCCQTKRTHFPCSPFPQSNMLRVWIVITVKSAFGTCLASSAQPWGGSRAVSGSATGSVCVCALLCLWHTLKYLCLCQREGEEAGTGGVSAKKNSHTWRVIYFLLIGFPCLYSPPPFVCLAACCHISILTETLDLMSGIVVLRPQGGVLIRSFLWVVPEIVA